MSHILNWHQHDTRVHWQMAFVVPYSKCLIHFFTEMIISNQNGAVPDKIFNLQQGGYPRGVMVKVMDCRIVVSKFVFQSHYYVHFRTNTLRKGINPLILPAMG